MGRFALRVAASMLDEDNIVNKLRLSSKVKNARPVILRNWPFNYVDQTYIKVCTVVLELVNY